MSFSRNGRDVLTTTIRCDILPLVNRLKSAKPFSLRPEAGK